MIRRPPRSTRVRSSAASDVYKRQLITRPGVTANRYERICGDHWGTTHMRHNGRRKRLVLGEQHRGSPWSRERLDRHLVYFPDTGPPPRWPYGHSNLCRERTYLRGYGRQLHSMLGQRPKLHPWPGEREHLGLIYPRSNRLPRSALHLSVVRGVAHMCNYHIPRVILLGKYKL